MKNSEKISVVLKKLRAQHFLKQSELAQIIGVSQATLSKIESGKRELKASQWIKICKLFKVPIDYGQ